jgi:hypothetical protein
MQIDGFGQFRKKPGLNFTKSRNGIVNPQLWPTEKNRVILDHQIALNQ